MTTEHWLKIKEVLGAAMELAPADRGAYLEQICIGEGQLRLEVERLLDDERLISSQFLNRTAFADATAAVLPIEDNPWIGRRVGAYRTTDLIGIGGMGEVYRAFRADDQYRKQVALKVVRAGQNSTFVLARFRNERQILASLDHPNIARLLDGGTTEDGIPYLVMELIEGQPITDYCDDHELRVEDRLALFMQVCAAVQYAHQRLIVHRDIKPGNIFVTAEGVPKLLDFGIAKILDVESESDSFRADRTLTAFRLMTPQYASPEQVRGECITTASDVFSLGVVLYELLAGCSPYPRTTSASQQARAVCELEPLKPSAMIQERNRDAELNTGSDSKSRSASDKLARQLGGDLDNIVLMAIRKELGRRYSSAEQFSEDIRRYLANLPVIARKDTPQYRVAKFASRHKAGLAATVGVALTLVVAFVVSIQETRIAKRRFNDVRTMANSLIFDVHDSVKDLPGSTPAKKLIVDRALRYLNVLAQESSGDLGLQRELAAAYERVGSVQGDYLENNLGDAEGTLASYKKALAIRQQITAASGDWTDRLALAQEYRLVAHQLWANGDPRGARDPIYRAIAISEALNTGQPNKFEILYELSFEHEVSGRIGYPGDSSARQKSLEDYRRALAADENALKLKPEDIPALHSYSSNLGDIGTMLEGLDAREALKDYEKELEIDRKLTQLSSDIRYKRAVGIAYGSIASVYDDLGDYSRSVENNLKDLAIYQELVTTDPKNTLLQQGLAITYMNTATSCARAGKIAAAMDYSNRSLQIMQVLVPSAPPTGFLRRVFASILIARGTVLAAARQPRSAMAAFGRGHSIYEALYEANGTNRADVAAADVKLGEAAAAGLDQNAANYFHQALTIAEPMISAQPPNLDALYAAADAYSGLGRLCMKTARRMGQTRKQQKSHWAEARSWYLRSQKTWQRIEHPNHTAPNFFQAGDPADVAKSLQFIDAALS